MLAHDKDLLALEPGLFRDASWVGQRLVVGTASVSATTLTLTSQDVNFEQAGVGAGSVVLIDNEPAEVIARTSATVLTVSKLRAGGDEPSIPLPTASAAAVRVFTFRPQLELVQRQVLRMLGLEPDAPAPAGQPTTEHIANPEALRPVIAVGAVHLALVAASALSGELSPLRQRADMYRRMYALQRERLVVRFDMQGDGSAEFVRRPNLMRFTRQ